MKVRNLTVNVVHLVGHLVNCFSKSRELARHFLKLLFLYMKAEKINYRLSISAIEM